LVAIDGKTARGSHDRPNGRAAPRRAASGLGFRHPRETGSGARSGGGRRGRADDDPGAGEVATATDLDKGHGRTEERAISVSTPVDWLDGKRRFPGEHRLSQLATIARVAARTWEKGKETRAVRFYVSSRPLTPQALTEAVRSHWAIENSLHWVLDVTFGEDKARSRTGHGPANMATMRHFAFNILRTVNDKKSLKLRRNKAARNPTYMATILGSLR
jgi:predicted transposase YbfD/YdcC